MKRFPGVVIGLVKDIDAAQARIKVQFPWLSDVENSAWAPVATPLTGGSRGMYYMPELEDEVLVAFEHGDFDHPFVVGFLWNGVDTPPESTKDNRIILTPGGHTLRFEDADGSKKVVLKSDSGHTITLDDTSGAGKVKVESTGGHTVTLDDVGRKIEVKSTGGHTLALDDTGQKIEAKTSGGVLLKLDDAGQSVTIQAAQSVTVQASTASVQASTINLGASAAQKAVLGDVLDAWCQVIVSLFNSHMHPGQLAAGVLPVTPMTPVPQFTAPQGHLSNTVKLI